MTPSDANAGESAHQRPNIEELFAAQNFPLAAVTGFVAAIIGAAAWAAVTEKWGVKLGLMCLVVGLLVGKAVCIFGKGLETRFKVLAVVLALFGVALGNVLSSAAFHASAHAMPLLDVLKEMTPSQALEFLTTNSGLVDFVLYGVALYEAYVSSVKYEFG